MEAARPKLQIPLTPLDTALEVLCWSGLVAIWIVAFLAYASLPEIIPIHFNPSGEADGYGSRGAILFLPVIPTVLIIGFTILNRYPHTFNYLGEITPANAERNYRMGTRLMRWLKLFLVVVFGSVLFLVINSANQNLSGSEITSLVNLVIAGVLLMPLVVLLIVFLQFRKNRSSNA